MLIIYTYTYLLFDLNLSLPPSTKPPVGNEYRVETSSLYDEFAISHRLNYTATHSRRTVASGPP
jgi:hypothetical protein